MARNNTKANTKSFSTLTILCIGKYDLKLNLSFFLNLPTRSNKSGGHHITCQEQSHTLCDSKYHVQLCNVQIDKSTTERIPTELQKKARIVRHRMIKTKRRSLFKHATEKRLNGIAESHKNLKWLEINLFNWLPEAIRLNFRATRDREGTFFNGPLTKSSFIPQQSTFLDV